MKFLLIAVYVCVCVDSVNMGKIAGHVDAEQPNGEHLPCFLAAWHLNLLPIYEKSTPGRANPSPTRIRKMPSVLPHLWAAQPCLLDIPTPNFELKGSDEQEKKDLTESVREMGGSSGNCSYPELARQKR